MKWGLLASCVVLYFALASYLKYTYWDPYSGRQVVLLKGFERLGNSPHAVTAHFWAPRPIGLEEMADSADNSERSPVIVYENGVPLGPAHSVHADILKLGMGRFSHWRGQGFVFSSSDNSDPMTNGRTYRAVLP